MKLLSYCTTIVLLFCSIFAFSQSKLAQSQKQSSKILIYKINKKDLQKVHLKNEGFSEQMLNTKVAEYMRGETQPVLPRGNYLCVSTVENKLNYTELIIDNLCAKAIAGEKFAICVYDTLGNIINDAKVKRGATQLKFDKTMQFYSTAKAKNEDMVEIDHRGVYHYWEVEHSPYYYGYNNQRKKTFWDNIGSAFATLAKNISYILQPSKRSQKEKYEGFVVFSKPKYKPDETVKLKAYLTDKRGNAYNKPINLKLQGSYYSFHQIDTVLAKLEPYRPGMYNYEFKLNNGLDLELDQSYYIVLDTGEKNTSYISNYFTYEEYELKGISFSLSAPKTEFTIGDTIKLKAKVSDENNMAVYDGKIEVLITPIDFDANKMKSMMPVFLPDTMWYHTIEMQGSSQKELIVPDSIFPKNSDIRFRVECTYLSADNEKHVQTLWLNYLDKKYTLDFAFKKGMLSIKELYEGKSQAARAKVVITGADDEVLSTDSVSLPHTLAMSWLTQSIKVETPNTNYIYSNSHSDIPIEYQFYRENDSIYLKVDNPANIPFWYTIRKMNRQIDRGYTQQLNYAIRDTDEVGYSMKLNYLYAGQNKFLESSLPFFQKNITMDVTTPTTVYPGQKTNVEISVMDKYGKPVENADITAYAFTSKFENYSIPHIPFDGKIIMAKQFIDKQYHLSDEAIHNAKSSMTWSRWAAPLALDTIEYYKFLYPESYYVQKEPTKDGSTQLSPFVIINGEVQGVHMLWVDSRLYYVKQAQQQDVYTFRVEPGVRNLRFRTSDREIWVQNVEIEESQKSIMSFDATNARTIIPYKDQTKTPFAVGSSLVHKNLRGNLSSVEIEELRKQLITVNNTSGKIRFPNIREVFEDPMYISAGQNLYYLNPTPRVEYSYNVQANVNTPILTGPFPQRNVINGLANIASVYSAGKLLVNTEIEGGNSYTVYPGFQKIKQWDKSVINRKLATFKTNLNFDQNVLSLKDIKQHINNQIQQALQRATGFVEQKQEDLAYGDKSMNLRLNLVLGKDSIGREIKPSLIFIGSKNSSEHQVYYGGTRYFTRLPSENLSLYLVFDDSTTYNYPLNLCKGGTNYLKLDSISYNRNNKEARAIYSMLKRRMKQTPVKNPYTTEPIKDSIMLSPVSETTTFSVKNQLNGLVRGTVKDEYGPLVGVTIQVKDSDKGAFTDMDGKFEIKTEKNTTLIIKCLGYKTKELKATVGYDYAVYLEEDDANLQESIVLGYGMTKRKNLTETMYTVSSVLAGVAPGVSFRGISTASAQSTPMIILDGVPYDSDLASIDESAIQAMEVMKDGDATAIYGSRATNGVIVITTNGKASTPDTDGGENSGNAMRRNFHDDAFWQPKLTTNKDGVANFEVTYPDDITSWNAYFIAVGNKKHTDTKQLSVNSFKSLTAKVSTPRFAIVGDSINAVGKLTNHLGDSLQLTRTISINHKSEADKLQINTSHIDYIPLTVNEVDSVTLAYSLQRDNGYFDGEERSFPILEQGILQTHGDFMIINDAENHVLNIDPDLGKVIVYAEASSLETFLREINNIDSYPYKCNEQMASKIKALLAKKYIYELQGKEFKEDKKINSLVKDLNKNKNEKGLWGWWNKSTSVMWISRHILDAMLEAEKAGYKTDLDKEKLSQIYIQNLKDGLASLPYITENSSSFTKNELLDKLIFLQRLGAQIDYKSYFEQINSQLKNKSINNKLKTMFVMSTIGLQDAIQIDSLMVDANKTILGSMYWGHETQISPLARRFYLPYETNVDNTLLAYEILKNIGGYDKEMQSIGNYFFELRKRNAWNNIYEASRIIQTVMPDMLRNTNQYASVEMDIAGNKISEFPYTAEFEPNASIEVSKTGTMPLFITAYQQEWCRTPKPEKSKGFEITTTFVMNNDTIANLKEGKATILQTTLTLDGDAEYVQIEIPIPAGCSYESKDKSYYSKEAHREYYKDKVVIFSNQLAKGEHTFNVELIARYTGRYTLNPAKAELMYFPTFYGNEEIKTTFIE